MTKDNFQYRQFTDRPEDEDPKPIEIKSAEEEETLGLGFRAFLPQSSTREGTDDSAHSTSTLSTDGICNYNGKCCYSQHRSLICEILLSLLNKYGSPIYPSNAFYKFAFGRKNNSISLYLGMVIDVGKLLSQLERSEQARFDNESRLSATQKILSNMRETEGKQSAIKEKLQV